jgi:hypothetical protein
VIVLFGARGCTSDEFTSGLGLLVALALVFSWILRVKER